MLRPRQTSESGFTLMELTVGVAMFTIVLGTAAQTLVTYYVALESQNQRNTVLQDCRGLLDDMRALRDQNTNNFPDAILARWPDQAEVEGVGSYHHEIVTVSYADTEANPLVVTVTAQWRNVQGHSMRMTLSSMLSDR